MTTLYAIGGAALVAIILLMVLFKAAWRVAEPNEALIISGLHERSPEGTAESLGFKIVTGRGVLVTPGVQQVRRLSLDLHEADLVVECVSQQGIPLEIRGVVIFKIGDDLASIANAARRFLDQQAQMDARVHNVFAGHLRSIAGAMTVEDMLHERERLTEETRGASGTEMQKLGLVIDSLQIQEIVDHTGYIDNLRKPHAATVQSQARIAEAAANQLATAREQEAAAANAQAERDANIARAGYKAEVEQATARAAQSGPLAEATARQEVVVQETEIAKLEADRAQQRLTAQVVRPAEAAAAAKIAAANAERDASIAQATAEAARTEKLGAATAAATKANGLAEAEAMAARGKAEGEAIKARSDALAQNQDAVLSQQLIQNLPAVVAAISAPLGNVDNLIVLDGAEGLTGVISSVIAQAGALKPLFGAFLGNGGSSSSGSNIDNGVLPVPPAAAIGDSDQ